MRHVVRRSRDAIDAHVDECIRHICRVLRCLRYVGLEEWMSLSSRIEIFFGGKYILEKLNYWKFITQEVVELLSKLGVWITENLKQEKEV